MPFSIKTKQVAGVTFIVSTAVVLLSAWYISSLAFVWLEEAHARAELVQNIITHRVFYVVQSGGDPTKSLQADSGLQSILQSSLYSDNVTSAAIVDASGITIAHSDVTLVGSQAPPVSSFATLLTQGPLTQAHAIYRRGGKSFEVQRPLIIGDKPFGSVRVAVSTLLIQDELRTQMTTPIVTAALAILLSSFVAMLLAQVTLRPIHVIRSGLARLGRGELDVDVDFPGDRELVELGDSFKAVTARLSAHREQLADQKATLESVVENLEDAMALFAPDGKLLFANPAMRPTFSGVEGHIDQLLPVGHPYRNVIEAALKSRKSLDPATVQVPGGGERLLLTHAVEDSAGEPLGVMLVARNLTYLSQVESTLSYSRKLAALGRLSAGIAHEVKNPLNATMIHLELLRMKLAEAPEALEHVSVIAAQVRRLDEVVQGFLKFTRPEELELQPVEIQPLIEELMPVISAEAGKSGVDVRLDFPPDLPAANADAGLLQQAFLNLALNACQAMPKGGRLRISGSFTAKRRIQIAFEDTGTGISPENLARIFDLYFTTKERGSGIGLSLVYRTVQLHDGEIEVQSVPGHGTTFRVLLREASDVARRPVAARAQIGPAETEIPHLGRTLSAS